MTRYTVQCGFVEYNACTVVVDAGSIEEACAKAVEEAGNDPHWKRLDHCGDTYVDAVAEGDDVDPWATNGSFGSALPIPDRFTEIATLQPSGTGKPVPTEALVGLHSDAIEALREIENADELYGEGPNSEYPALTLARNVAIRMRDKLEALAIAALAADAGKSQALPADRTVGETDQ